MTIELLYFAGCPSYEALLPRLRLVLDQERIDEQIELRRVESPEQAETERFLGSPTLRIDGRDVDPGAEARDDFGLKCRLYRSEAGLERTPPDEWIIAALRGRVPPRPRGDAVGPEEALEAIGVARSSFAKDRVAGLPDGDRKLYRAILERLAAGKRPDEKWLTDEGAATEAVDRLAAADLIALDAEGGVALAYPLSAHPSRHRVELDDGRQLWACCAIDALGIPAMVGVAGTVVAQTPGGEGEVHVQVGPRGEPIADPVEAVVLAGVAGDGTTACRACPFINFFGSEATASAFQEQHPEMTASVLSIANAATAGRRLFGDLLVDPQALACQKPSGTPQPA